MLFEKYIQKGSMRPIKKILGGILFGIGIGLFIFFDELMGLIHTYT